ncbi:alpha/beta hydrolase family protein [Alteromonas gilva]|uniref:Prolyl oligopeptidase family serine peptidase n=1 Tax=Alteromonas gilva TaxID=2987522 RepID=A0ABT5L790_9ALTE|nr:prolyl oligopeptidase family serine peptidase [Alteromonas gilva]MDC8831682.1 prolyl oligopeptidase family serine peptidase [Alteromonas gilva]
MKKLLLAGITLLGIPFSMVGNAQTSPEEQISTIESFAILPAIRSVQISPDGKQLALVRATSKDGDYIIEIHQTNQLGKDPVRLGADKMRVSGVSWLNNEKIGVNFRQLLEDGGSKYWVAKFAVTDADGKGDWLIPFRERETVSFSVVDMLEDDDDNILVEIDINDNYIPDVVKLNIKTGRSSTVLRGNTEVSNGFVADSDGEVRIGQGWNRSKQAIETYVRAKGEDEWILINSNGGENRENFDIAGFSIDDPNKLHVVANHGEDTTGVYLMDIKTGEYSERLFGLNGYDVDGVRYDDDGHVIGYTYTTKFGKTFFEDEEFKALQESIDGLSPSGRVSIASASDDYNQVILYTQASDDPGTYYLLSNKKDLMKLGERMPFIDKSKLGKTLYVSYKARDGRKINAYVTKPQGEAPFPTIVLPHGGPWVRDAFVFDDWSQLLASHGYLVIQPNYRGSIGYGLEHWKAGDKNWGLTMQDDLDDAANFLVSKGLADKDKLAMFGWSYGGYAAFAATLREPNIYQCTVAGAGVSDLSRINATLNESPLLSKLQKPTIDGVSPVENVAKANVPILVIHGDIDQRVPIKHSDAFVDELKRLNKDHKYVVLDGADHFSDTLFYDHKMQFYGELINWLDNKCGLAPQ